MGFNSCLHSKTLRATALKFTMPEMLKSFALVLVSGPTCPMVQKPKIGQKRLKKLQIEFEDIFTKTWINT